MDRLSLVKSDQQNVEKRTFPRFPFGYLVFKSDKEDSHAFHVKDISFTGMQLALKSGNHHFKKEDPISGIIHWKGRSLVIRGRVVWQTDSKLGVRFDENDLLKHELREFLSVHNIIQEMRPIHQNPVGVDIPRNLKIWLKADGPFELFIWTHLDGEISKFQMMMMDSFLEYEDGSGLRTGKILRVRDKDTPLFCEDEFIFSMDEKMDEKKYQLSQEIINALPERLIDLETREFLYTKVGLK